MSRIQKIKDNMERVIVGKAQVIDYILTTMLAGGHVLLEDVPGTGKTVMAKTLAKSLHGSFSRIQFTPDLLPSDVTGLNIYNQKTGEFELKKGPVFGNILLADEINRATPRTQSSLLECMEERQVTIDGVTYPLDLPFFVIATENPIETAGTFPLPEAQLDRFMMKLSMGLVGVEEEVQILNRFLKNNEAQNVESVMSTEELAAAAAECEDIFVHPELVRYMASIAYATRNNRNIVNGASPRGTLALLRAVKAYAYIKDRSYVVPEDIRELAVPVLAHRIVTNSMTGDGGKNILEEIINTVEVPTEEWGK